MKQPKKQAPKVVSLLQGLAPQERTKLIEALGVSRATYYRWQNAPGSIPVAEAEAIQRHLSKLHGQEYDLLELWSTSKKGKRQAA